MENRKYNVILGLLIFSIVIIVGIIVAWGLGYIGVKENAQINDKQNEQANTNTSEETVAGKDETTSVGSKKEETDNKDKQEETKNNEQKEETKDDTKKEETKNNTQKEETKNNTQKDETESKVEKLNKEYVTKYLSAMNAGSPEGRVQIIMEYDSYDEMDSHYTSTVIDDIYKVTDIKYSTFKGKLSFISDTLASKLYSYKNQKNLLKEYDGKLAIHQGSWSGSSFKFVSQKLVSNKNNEYTWKVVVQVDNTKETYTVIGKLSGTTYTLTSIPELVNNTTDDSKEQGDVSQEIPNPFDEWINELEIMSESLQSVILQSYNNKSLSGVQVRSAFQQYLESEDTTVILLNSNMKMIATVGAKKLKDGTLINQKGYFEISSANYSAEGGTLHKTTMAEINSNVSSTGTYRSCLLKVSGTDDIVGIVFVPEN